MQWIQGFLLASLFLLTSSCSPNTQPITVELPPTPILRVRINWGVVLSPYLRVRQQPSMEGEIVAHLRNSTVVQVLSRTAFPETIEGMNDFWYEVFSEGRRGWVFGGHLQFFPSRQEAERAVKSIENS